MKPNVLFEQWEKSYLDLQGSLPVFLTSLQLSGELSASSTSSFTPDIREQETGGEKISMCVGNRNLVIQLATTPCRQRYAKPVVCIEGHMDILAETCFCILEDDPLKSTDIIKCHSYMNHIFIGYRIAEKVTPY